MPPPNQPYDPYHPDQYGSQWEPHGTVFKGNKVGPQGSQWEAYYQPGKGIDFMRGGAGAQNWHDVKQQMFHMQQGERTYQRERELGHQSRMDQLLASEGGAQQFMTEGQRLAQAQMRQGMGETVRGMNAAAVGRGGSPLAQRAAIQAGGQAGLQAVNASTQTGAAMSAQAAQLRQQMELGQLQGTLGAQNLALEERRRQDAWKLGNKQLNQQGGQFGAGMGMQLAGAGIGAVAGLAAMSDENSKTNIQPLGSAERLAMTQAGGAYAVDDYNREQAAKQQDMRLKELELAQGKEQDGGGVIGIIAGMGSKLLGGGQKQQPSQGFVNQVTRYSSDEDSKTGANDGGSAMDDALRVMPPYQYQYKPDAAMANGQDTAPRAGIMAQDAEQNPLSAAMVRDTPQGKTIDIPTATSFLLAAVSRINERLDRDRASKRGSEPRELNPRMYQHEMAHSSAGAGDSGPSGSELHNAIMNMRALAATSASGGSMPSSALQQQLMRIQQQQQQQGVIRPGEVQSDERSKEQIYMLSQENSRLRQSLADSGQYTESQGPVREPNGMAPRTGARNKPEILFQGKEREGLPSFMRGKDSGLRTNNGISVPEVKPATKLYPQLGYVGSMRADEAMRPGVDPGLYEVDGRRDPFRRNRDELPSFMQGKDSGLKPVGTVKQAQSGLRRVEQAVGTLPPKAQSGGMKRNVVPVTKQQEANYKKLSAPAREPEPSSNGWNVENHAYNVFLRSMNPADLPSFMRGKDSGLHRPDVDLADKSGMENVKGWGTLQYNQNMEEAQGSEWYKERRNRDSYMTPKSAQPGDFFGDEFIPSTRGIGTRL